MAKSVPFSLVFVTLIVFFNHVSSSFTPVDNYLINCGSNSPSILDSFHRNFIGDESSGSNSVKLTATRSISLNEVTPFGGLYNSVRIFTKPSNHVFTINSKGTHFVRIHFHRLSFDKFDGKDLNFHVMCNGYLLLSNFSVLSMNNDVEIREFIIWVDDHKLELDFIPVSNTNFGFVSAIEVISAPKDLISDTALIVNPNGVNKIDGIVKNGFETVFRVNVGGPKITPFNDTLWKTWVNDNEYMKSNIVSKEVHFSGRIKYRVGGASREVAPDHVYGSARMISSDSSDLKQNLTWKFPVDESYKYLIRVHFCDIISPALGSLYFNVYINGVLAYNDLDLSRITNNLASPFYTDFVIDEVNDGVIRITVGSSSLGGNALLNGVEIFKMSNSMKSFNGVISAESMISHCHGENGGFPFLFVIAIGVLLAVSLLLRRIFATVQESVSWSRLPMNVSEVALKSSYQ